MITKATITNKAIQNNEDVMSLTCFVQSRQGDFFNGGVYECKLHEIPNKISLNEFYTSIYIEGEAGVYTYVNEDGREVFDFYTCQ
jgi:hypothetical protein